MYTEDVLLLVESEPDILPEIEQLVNDPRMPVRVEMVRDEQAFWLLQGLYPDAPVLVGNMHGLHSYEFAQVIARRCPDRVVAVLDDEGAFEPNGVRPTRRTSLPSMLPLLFAHRDFVRVKRKVSDGFRLRVAA